MQDVICARIQRGRELCTETHSCCSVDLEMKVHQIICLLSQLVLLFGRDEIEHLGCQARRRPPFSHHCRSRNGVISPPPPPPPPQKSGWPTGNQDAKVCLLIAIHVDRFLNTNQVQYGDGMHDWEYIRNHPLGFLCTANKVQTNFESSG